jgi:hypothetical protein
MGEGGPTAGFATHPPGHMKAGDLPNREHREGLMRRYAVRD